METGVFWELGSFSDAQLRSGLSSLLANGYRTEARIIAHIAEVEERKSIALFSLSCSAPDAVDVRVFYDAPADAPLLENVTVFAGGDVHSWASVQPGDSVGVVLSPGGDLPDVILQYTQRHVQSSWHGPKYPAAVGYGIGIHVAADETVKEHHCKWRCGLD